MPNQIDKINKTVADINQATSGTNLQQITPLKPITPQDITGDVPVFDATGTNVDIPETKVEVPEAPDQFVQAQEKSVQDAQTAESASFEAFVQNALQAPTESEIRADVEAETGFAEKQLRVKQLQTELITEQDRLRTIKERIQKEGGGLKSGAAAEIANAERESYAKQADIALVQLAAQDQLDYATSIVDRTVDAMFSRQERINDVLGLVYERNKSLFDKEEQRLFETKQADRERKLTQEKEDERILQSAKIEALKMAQLNGAPQEVIDAIGRARSAEEVLVAGGQYASGDLLDRMYKKAQIDNIYDTINQRRENKIKEIEAAESEKEKLRLQRESDTEQSLGIKELATQLQTAKGLSAAVGFGFKKSLMGAIPLVSGEATAGTSRADFEALATRLTNMLTIDNLQLMTGVLTDKDIKILETAGSNLGNFDQSEKQYMEEIQRVIDVADRVINKNGLTEEQALFWGMLGEDEVDEINSIFE